jgi:dolichyl-phosphate-mannose-protein mannosyltransferase
VHEHELSAALAERFPTSGRSYRRPVRLTEARPGAQRMATPALPSAGSATVRPAVANVARGHWHRVILAVICSAAAAMAVGQAIGDAPSTDEPLYVTAGLVSLVRHSLWVNPQHPPLAKALAAVPVLLADPKLPSSFGLHSGRRYSRKLLNSLGRHEMQEITLLSRLVPMSELVSTALVVYALASRLGGRIGGLLAAALWVFDPFVIGLGHVDGIDLPGTLTALVLALAIARWMETRTRVGIVAIGLACGAALVVRDTGPLLLAAALLTVVLVARDVRPALAVAAASFVVVWVVYGALDPLYTLHHPNVLPQRYLSGFISLQDHHRRPGGASLLGAHWVGAKWWFYPVSALIKLPVTLLASCALGVLLLYRVPRDHLRRVLVAVLPSTVVLAAFTLAIPVNFGLRYMLPVLAFLTVLAAPLARTRWLLPAALVAGSVAFTVASLPHSTAWVNPPFEPGYRVAATDNLDWGQDAFLLQDWAAGKRAWVACYSPWKRCAQVIPGAHVLHANTPRSRVHGWVGISATDLTRGWDPWLGAFRPVRALGGTEVIYRIP